MFAQIEYPVKLLPDELDHYLARGWFRMRQAVFTTNFLHFNNCFYSAIWLRVSLDNYQQDKKLVVLNKNFTTEIKACAPALVQQAHENLFQHYRQGIAFEVSATLQELLYGSDPYNRFNTWEVNVYDGATLIAAGFFDLGNNSAAGITCIYHPAYRKYSLGKYLMQLKMAYCKDRQLQYFYPGYAVPGYQPFDYKLALAKNHLQYLRLATGQWQYLLTGTPMDIPLNHMVQQLIVLQLLLGESNLSNSLLYYRFFEANLDPYYYSAALFDFPVFIQCNIKIDHEIFLLVVYDLGKQAYQLFACSSVIHIGFRQDSVPVFDADLLRVDYLLYSAAAAKGMVEYLASRYPGIIQA